MDCSPPGSFVHEIFQARVLECVAISFFRDKENYTWRFGEISVPTPNTITLGVRASTNELWGDKHLVHNTMQIISYEVIVIQVLQQD